MIFSSIFLEYLWGTSEKPVGIVPDVFGGFFRKTFQDSFGMLQMLSRLHTSFFFQGFFQKFFGDSYGITSRILL